MPDSLFLEERRRAILDTLASEGRVLVRQLSETMQVSEVTIRQDLRALEDQGLLERTYGGAVYKGGTVSLKELSFNVRLTKMRKEKEAIARAAVALVGDGYSIALDCSTTIYALVPYLKKSKKLTLVTNSLALAQSFLDNEEHRVLMAGGRLRRDAMSMVGQPESLPDINLNIGFFSSRGLAAGIGASEVDPDEAIIKQAMLARCVRAVLLIDSSKWGQVAPYTIAPDSRLQHIITSEEAPRDLVEYYRSSGVRVDLVKTFSA